VENRTTHEKSMGILNEQTYEDRDLNATFAICLLYDVNMRL